MNYRKMGNTGCMVSALGFGCMRFPCTDPENDKTIDEELSKKMLRYAIDNGVNYVDTAFFYHGGESERFVGRALKDGYREKVYLATKLPMGEVKEEGDFDRLLNEQLVKLDTDHIDFYLFHALNAGHWETVKRFGFMEKMKRAKAEGKIRHIGFSFHDDLETFKKIVDEFECAEFCQVMYNYENVDFQAGEEGIAYAAAKGLGVIVMEPLRGGKLAEPVPEVKAVFPEGTDFVKSALDFVWDNENVSLLLSGMSSFEQTVKNIEYACGAKENKLTAGEKEIFVRAKKAADALVQVPCTNCRYCQPCPNDVCIPDIFAAYNKITRVSRGGVLKLMPDIAEKTAACVACGACEAMCPQNIKIIDELKKINEKFSR